MYICQITGQSIGPGVPIHRIVVETREKEYQIPIYERNRDDDGKKKKRRRKKGKVIDWRTAYGTEIVKEISVCPEEYEKNTGLKAQAARPEKQQQQKKPFKKRFRKEESERMKGQRDRRRRNAKTPRG